MRSPASTKASISTHCATNGRSRPRRRRRHRGPRHDRRPLPSRRPGVTCRGERGDVFVLPASAYAEVLVRPAARGATTITQVDTALDAAGIGIADADRVIARRVAAPSSRPSEPAAARRPRDRHRRRTRRQPPPHHRPPMERTPTPRVTRSPHRHRLGRRPRSPSSIEETFQDHFLGMPGLVALGSIGERPPGCPPFAT